MFEEHTGANSGVELKGFQHCRTSDVDDFSQVLTRGPVSTLLLGFGFGSSSCYCYYGVFTDPDHPKASTHKTLRIPEKLRPRPFAAKGLRS